MVGFYNKNHYAKGDFDGTGTHAYALLVGIRGAKPGQQLPVTRVDVSLLDDLGISARDEIQERYSDSTLLFFSDKSKYFRVVDLDFSGAVPTSVISSVPFFDTIAFRTNPGVSTVSGDLIHADPT